MFGIGTDPNVLAAVQAHWRAGTGGTPNILDTDPSAVTDLIAFLRTIDDNTPPFPAADLAPNDPIFADAGALCDCEKDPPLGNPGARLPALSAFRPGSRPSPPLRDPGRFVGAALSSDADLPTRRSASAGRRVALLATARFG